jgi:hypothetical protein
MTKEWEELRSRLRGTRAAREEVGEDLEVARAKAESERAESLYEELESARRRIAELEGARDREREVVKCEAVEVTRSSSGEGEGESEALIAGAVEVMVKALGLQRPAGEAATLPALAASLGVVADEVKKQMVVMAGLREDMGKLLIELFRVKAERAG